MIIFDGIQLANEREEALRERVAAWRHEQSFRQPHIVAILFEEDAGSVLYSTLKQEAAERIGLTYELQSVKITQPLTELTAIIQAANSRPEVTGIIIQKPRRSIWEQASRVVGDPKDVRAAFNLWWELLTTQLEITKDVDGLHPSILKAMESGTFVEEGRVLPATVKAVVLTVLEAARELEWGDVGSKTKVTQNSDILFINQSLSKLLKDKKTAIIGKSDLLGKPLAALLKKSGLPVALYGRAELERARQQGVYLHDADIVVSATGIANLLTATDIKTGAVVIDVGEPRPDVDFDSVATKAAFISPVPGGIGPLTVVSLMENGVELANGNQT